MMRRVWPLALGGIAVLLFILALNMPARLLPYFLEAQPLQMSGVSGTLQSGKAARARLQHSGIHFHLGQLTWNLSPWSLFRLVPRVQLRSVWGDQRGRLAMQLHGDQLVLEAVDITLNAALLKQVLPVELQGRLGMLFDELVLTTDKLISAQGRIVWQEAVWQSPGGLRPLGSYAATITSEADQQMQASIVTLSGPVVASGTVTLTKKRYAVDLLVESSGQEFDAELSQALSLIASPEENGYRLRVDGELTPGV